MRIEWRMYVNALFLGEFFFGLVGVGWWLLMRQGGRRMSKWLVVVCSVSVHGGCGGCDNTCHLTLALPQ